MRLQALADAPDAFDSTFQDALAWGEADWRRWLARGTLFLFEGQGGMLGMAAGVPDPHHPASPFLQSVWVHPMLRGSGAGDLLIQAVLAWARAAGAAEVVLHVEKRHESARRAYERNGFRATGVEVPRERDGLPEVEMRLRFLSPLG